MLLIDNHVHAGDKYGPVEKVIETMDAHGVTHAAIVQHMGQYNNTYLVESITKYPNRFWAVGMVDLELPDAPKTLRHWLRKEKLHGVRLPASSLSKRPDVWDAAAENRGVISVSGLQPRDAGQVYRMKQFLDENPTAKIKIEHLGHPDPTLPPPYPTYLRIMELAEYKNVYLQLSSPYSHSEGAFPYEDMAVFAQIAKKHFGPWRLLWGSCYPPVEKFMTYKQSLDWLDTLGFDDKQRTAILQNNPVRLWDPQKRVVGDVDLT
jgi:predicted TIM-barrel fold metal-dependent hydrolase